MATFINVTVGEAGLLEQDRQQREVQRLAASEQRQRSKLSRQKKTSEQEPNGREVKRLPVLRSPAANRTPVGGAVMGVTYEMYSDNYAARTSKLRVGTPDFQVVAEVGGISDPDLRVINDVTLPASGNNGTVVEAVGGIHYVDSSFANPYQAWSGLYATGVGAPPLLYQGTAPPPSKSQVDTWTAFYDTYSTDQSRQFVVPAGGQNCVFIYVHNKLKMYNIYRRIRRREQTTENARTEAAMAPGIGTGTWYDMRQVNRTIYEYVNTQTFAAYEIFAFLVTPRAVTQLTVPSTLETLIRAICPPVSVNGTTSRLLESAGGQVSGYGPGSTSYFFTLPNVYGNMPSIDDSAWQASATYGTIPYGNDVLAKQFGIGWLQYNDHKGYFFSPAVFSYLQASLTLTGTDAKDYSAMRLQLNGKPPTKYLAPCVPFCSGDDTEFSVTRTMPATTSDAIPESSFQPDRRYVVKRGEVSGGTLYYCWDWDDKAYCRQQMLALGFTALPYAT